MRLAEWEHLGILGTPDPSRSRKFGASRLSKQYSSDIDDASAWAGVQQRRGRIALLDSTSGVVKADDHVAPGETYTYIWTAPESSGPGPLDGSSVIWMYHSSFAAGLDLNTGLVGPILVTARGQGRPDGTPKDVDREFITDFAIFDETEPGSRTKYRAASSAGKFAEHESRPPRETLALLNQWLHRRESPSPVDEEE